MESPNMKARISQLHKTEAEWGMLPDFVPVKGELIVFDPDRRHRYARLKIGDGATKLQKLPFIVDFAIKDFLADQYDIVVDAGRVSDYAK
jgi:hypothetical protein